MNECNEFLKHVAALDVLVGNVEAEDLQQVIDRAHSWQVQLSRNDINVELIWITM